MTADTSIQCPKCLEEALLTCDFNNNIDTINCSYCNYYEEIPQVYDEIPELT